jgi:signal transduction histidine kinase
VAQAHLISHPQSKLWLLQVTFVLIIAGFVLGNLAVLITGQRVAAVNRDLVKNAILSIDNLNGVIRDLDQKRLLVDAHIFESKPEEMEALEIRIAQTDADQDKFARAFEPLAKSREHALWEKVWDEVVALRQPVQKALDLSRSNRDTEARARMLMIEKRFDGVNEDVSELIGINREASHHSVDQIHAIQDRTLAFIGAMALIGGLLALFAALHATRIIRRRDDEIAQGSLLLETRNRELDAFAGRVAHDLRGPLTTVSLSATRLIHQLSHDEQETTYQTLRRGVARMEAIIRDLLVLSRAETMIHEAIAQTPRIAQSLEQELDPQVKGVNGVLRIQMEPASVQCSEGLLHQALWNIGENAIKYRRHEVPIHIDPQRTRRQKSLRISHLGQRMRNVA